MALNLSDDNLSIWDIENPPREKLYSKIKEDLVLRDYPKLDELLTITPLQFPSWLEEFQQYADKHSITVYAA